MPDLRDHIRRRIVTPANPAAGSGADIVVPGTEVWMVESVVFRLVTSVAAATRVVRLEADDQSTIYWRSVAGASQITNLTRDYAAFGGNTRSAAVESHIPLPLPTAGLVLEPGHRLRILVDNIDAADQASNIVARIVAYPTGPRTTPTIEVDTLLEPRDGIDLGVPAYYTP